MHISLFMRYFIKTESHQENLSFLLLEIKQSSNNK